MAINPTDPFGYGQSWGNFHEVGGTDTGDDLQVGNLNQPEPNDATRLLVPAAKNAGLFVENKAFRPSPPFDPGDGGVGIFGQSFSTKRGIGVAGECEAGSGVYGITSGDGVGVVGRCMSGLEVEDAGVEQLAPHVGVLGHSMKGPGVRGHSGPLLAPKELLPSPVIADPGGVFSSGQLRVSFVAGLGAQQESIDSLPQLRLTPSVNPELPMRGMFGDLFVNIIRDVATTPPTNTAAMWLCISPGDGSPMNKAMWAPFVLGAPQPGTGL
jgi:hypothetical protein